MIDWLDSLSFFLSLDVTFCILMKDYKDLCKWVHLKTDAGLRDAVLSEWVLDYNKNQNIVWSAE